MIRFEILEKIVSQVALNRSEAKSFGRNLEAHI
jgi:hypothetical protein